MNLGNNQDKKIDRKDEIYSRLKQDLESIRDVSLASPNYQIIKNTGPIPIPSSTGVPFNEWERKKTKKSEFNKSKVCLEMRISSQMRRIPGESKEKILMNMKV